MSRHLAPRMDGSTTLVRVAPADAGWRYSGLTVLTLPPGAPQTVDTGDSEMIVLPLSGSLRVDVAPSARHAGTVLDLIGRDSVFTRVSDFAYVGRNSRFALVSDHGAHVALPSARCDARLAPAYGPAEEVPVEVRGAGPATRQVTNFAVPGSWDHADKLICCELITPAGNWSSYPPHKHDVSPPCDVVNEEIYLYRIAGADQVTPDRSGVGYHRTYTGPEHHAAGLDPVDDVLEVRDLDTVLVPYGYHGPSVAAPGYPMYYLNVMAGPGDERSMAFCDDPAHTWIRGSWAEEQPDSRCPVTSARGRAQPATDRLAAGGRRS